MALNNLISAYEKYNINPMKRKSEDKEKKDVNNNINKVNNMMQGNISSQYLENKVMTASKEELTLMLYDGAIRFANKAILYINNGKIQEAHNAIIRTQDIYMELIVSLNREYDIANELYSLYEYIYNRLIDANLDKDIEILNEVISYSREFRDTWVEAMKIVKKK